MDVKKFNITDDEQFALDLLHEKKILIARGGGFNWAEPDHFRIVYLPRMEVLKESSKTSPTSSIATVNHNDRDSLSFNGRPVTDLGRPFSVKARVVGVSIVWVSGVRV